MEEMLYVLDLLFLLFFTAVYFHLVQAASISHFLVAA